MLKSCKICLNKFDYCPSCSVTKNPYKNGGYCGEACYNISMILQCYGSHLKSAAETIKALEPYNINKMSLQPNIDTYYKGVLNEAEAQKPKRKIKQRAEVVPQEDVEVVVNNDEDTTISEIE